MFGLTDETTIGEIVHLDTLFESPCDHGIIGRCDECDYAHCEPVNPAGILSTYNPPLTRHKEPTMEFQVNTFTIRNDGVHGWEVLGTDGLLIATFRTIHDARSWAQNHAPGTRRP